MRKSQILLAACTFLMFCSFERAADYRCDDPNVLNRLKEALTCGVQCVPGMTNEEVSKKREADLSTYIEGLLSEGRAGQTSADVITRYIASVFARGILDGLTDITGITTRVRSYDPVTRVYECEADLQFDSTKLASFKKFYQLKLLLAPSNGSTASVEARNAVAASRNDPEALDADLSNEVTALMATGFQSAISKIRYTVGDSRGGLVLTLDSNFTDYRMLHRDPAPLP